jgi:hypothetical protein
MAGRRERIARSTRCLAVVIAGVTGLLLPVVADARSWRGDVSHRGNPTPGATVEICGVSGTTNNSGRFRIEVPDDKQSCKIVVRHANRVSSAKMSGPAPYLSLRLKESADGWVVEIR